MIANASLSELLDEEPEVFDRISSNPEVLGGKPCVAGTRVSVQVILEWLAGGGGIGDIIAHYPFLKTEDVQQAIRFAASHMAAKSFADHSAFA